MPVIPAKIYALVERKLKDRWMLLPRAKMALYEAQEAAYAVSSPPMDQDKVNGGIPGDRTQMMAMRILAAQKKVDEAEAWVEAIRMTDRAFPWESTQEGVIAGYLYGNGMTIQETMLATKKGRTTVIHLRDNYVAHCALFAASMGLIRIGDDQREEDQELADPGAGRDHAG